MTVIHDVSGVERRSSHYYPDGHHGLYAAPAVNTRGSANTHRSRSAKLETPLPPDWGGSRMASSRAQRHGYVDPVPQRSW